MMPEMSKVELAIIGGSGLETFDELETQTFFQTETKYGYPSDDITIKKCMDNLGKERFVAFLPRHKRDHSLPPHKIPYKANIAALKSLGVREVIGACIAGSLQLEIKPGDFLIPDQFVNLTWGRDDCFEYDHHFLHLPMSEPYCNSLRVLLADQARKLGVSVHTSGTVAVIQGPRFSTRAESQWFTAQGWNIVNMTQYPECYFAREAGICYASVATITDYDVGLGENVQITQKTMKKSLEVFKHNIELTKKLLLRTIAVEAIPQVCSCSLPMPQEYYKQ